MSDTDYERIGDRILSTVEDISGFSGVRVINSNPKYYFANESWIYVSKDSSSSVSDLYTELPHSIRRITYNHPFQNGNFIIYCGNSNIKPNTAEFAQTQLTQRGTRYLQLLVDHTNYLYTVTSLQNHISKTPVVEKVGDNRIQVKNEVLPYYDSLADSNSKDSIVDILKRLDYQIYQMHSLSNEEYFDYELTVASSGYDSNLTNPPEKLQLVKTFASVYQYPCTECGENTVIWPFGLESRFFCKNCHTEYGSQDLPLAQIFEKHNPEDAIKKVTERIEPVHTTSIPEIHTQMKSLIKNQLLYIDPDPEEEICVDVNPQKTMLYYISKDSGVKVFILYKHTFIQLDLKETYSRSNRLTDTLSENTFYAISCILCDSYIDKMQYEIDSNQKQMHPEKNRWASFSTSEICESCMREVLDKKEELLYENASTEELFSILI